MTEPQWEACKTCGGDHWTSDHAPEMTADREPQTEAGRALLRLRWDGHVAGSMREHILAIEAEARADERERAEQVLTYVEAALDANRAGRATGVSAALMKAEHALRALLTAPAPPPAGIDVERLAEALEAEAASGRWDGEDGPMRWSSLTLAALIAAEYERLSDDAIEAEARADAAREAQPDVPEGHVCSLPINHTGPHRTRAEAQPLDWDEAVAVARALAAPDPDP